MSQTTERFDSEQFDNFFVNTNPKFRFLQKPIIIQNKAQQPYIPPSYLLKEFKIRASRMGIPETVAERKVECKER